MQLRDWQLGKDTYISMNLIGRNKFMKAKNKQNLFQLKFEKNFRSHRQTALLLKLIDTVLWERQIMLSK